MTVRRSRSTLAGAAVLAGALLLSACGGGGGAELAADAPLPTQVPPGTELVIADQAEAQQVALKASGELGRLPFTPRFANFTGGPAILEAFRAGAADIASVGDTPPIQALVAGDDVPIVLAKQNDPSSTQLAVAPGRPIRKLADLRGAKIAYAEGTAQQVIVLRALAKAGLTTADVQLVRLQLGDFNDAVRTGQVDVAVLNEPRLTRFLTEAGPRGGGVIDPAETADTSSGLNYLYARRAALQDPAKAAAIRAYVQHYIAAQQWVNTHNAEWVQQYYVDNQGIPAADGKRIIDSLGPSSFPRLDTALVARQQNTIDVMARAGELPRPATAADGFDLRFDQVVAEAGTRTGAPR
ncbi:ABC transporter substrate-binding protein [Pseudonocardia endophytica]|uniref:Sulfonate transport system substrate-binding protein n=1 Tax=Pseudonocardia endophytica TaxID=401976 RepID=A0A4R1HNI4_PSEEN|nr:ABC transporter substrate-binding protein [Pseudonocardia endophytica]TCK22165.1 sulfonate transport system substrate-binding protein [Pseudonocardia endophytica]